jgi:hypothetical protein
MRQRGAGCVIGKCAGMTDQVCMCLASVCVMGSLIYYGICATPSATKRFQRFQAAICHPRSVLAGTPKAKQRAPFAHASLTLPPCFPSSPSASSASRRTQSPASPESKTICDRCATTTGTSARPTISPGPPPAAAAAPAAIPPAATPEPAALPPAATPAPAALPSAAKTAAAMGRVLDEAVRTTARWMPIADLADSYCGSDCDDGDEGEEEDAPRRRTLGVRGVCGWRCVRFDALGLTPSLLVGAAAVAHASTQRNHKCTRRRARPMHPSPPTPPNAHLHAAALSARKRAWMATPATPASSSPPGGSETPAATVFDTWGGWEGC